MLARNISFPGGEFPAGYRPDWTALVTPFLDAKFDCPVDWPGLQGNIEFQLAYGMNPLSAGTTGESPTLGTEEHRAVNAFVYERSKGKAFALAGTGSNSTEEAMELTRFAAAAGIRGVLLVDCYYNGPSSMELREEYYARIAEAYPGLAIIPYVIPGRTGTALGVEDLAILRKRHPNVVGVKDATGDMGRVGRTRQALGDDFLILSGDDDKTYGMMSRPDIGVNGVISVVSNVAPKAIADMTDALRGGDTETAERLNRALSPLFGIVTVKTTEDDYHGFSGVEQKFRNPLPIKTLMNGLGMPAGPCRRPLGRMTRKGVEVVKDAAKAVLKDSPEILAPIQEFYGIDVEERITIDTHWQMWE